MEKGLTAGAGVPLRCQGYEEVKEQGAGRSVRLGWVARIASLFLSLVDGCVVSGLMSDLHLASCRGQGFACVLPGYIDRGTGGRASNSNVWQQAAVANIYWDACLPRLGCSHCPNLTQLASHP